MESLLLKESLLLYLYGESLTLRYSNFSGFFRSVVKLRLMQGISIAERISIAVLYGESLLLKEFSYSEVEADAGNLYCMKEFSGEVEADAGNLYCMEVRNKKRLR